MIGQTISHYRITEKLGGGGMGVVYKAIDTKLDRPVALKFLPPELTRDADAKRRFVHEAKAASALQHNNICAIHEIDEAVDGRMFICMDYYEGETLKQRIARRPLPVDEAIDITCQVAEGLAEAHAAGMVHRDLKPANILVTEKGVAKILDFGLAKLAGQTKVTKTGTTVGTVAYMSPEQATGKDIDQRSDVFSLGTVFYEMLTGELPFKGDHEAAVLYGITHNHPEPLTKHRTDVPEDLKRIVETMLCKDPGERYQGASETAADLARFRKGISTTGYSGEPARSVTRRVLTVAVVSILVVTTGYLLFSRYLAPGTEEADATRKMIAVLPFENLGSPEDEYFADGVTEEITARLAGVHGLGVIARTSSMRYKNTDKTVQQIGKELGVEYIMEGTIRWQRRPQSADRIRVTPQLIRVSDATNVWADVYDEPVAEVFDVQAGIAMRVADALDIALMDRERHSVESIPTDNFDAYTHYLNGRASQTKSWAEADQRNAERAYEKAIELDPEFALAYARLSEVHSEIFFQLFDPTMERATMARKAADRALQLRPDLPEAHMAMGKYYYECQLDYDSANEHYEIAAKNQAKTGELSARMAWVQRRQGKWADALENIKRASELDPRSALLAAEVGGTYTWLRNYRQAERYYDRGISLDPENGEAHIWKLWTYLLWDGNTERAQKVLRKAREHLDENVMAEEQLLIDIFDGRYQDALKRLSKVSTETAGGRGFVISYVPTVQYYADVYNLMGESQLAQSYYDSARVFLEIKIEKSPKNPRFHTALGIAYARLGQKEDAIREGKLGVELLPISKDAITGYCLVRDLAKIYTSVGEYDAAIDRLDYLLSIPGDLSAPLLRLDPVWLPLNDHPQFQKLLDKYSLNHH